MTATATEGTATEKPKRKGPPRSLKKLREALERRVLESLWFDDFGGSDLFNEIRGRDAEQGWVPITVVSDRRKGANWPLWRTEVELDRYRQQSRILSRVNDYAKCLLKNLTNFVIGPGFSYSAQPKKLNKPPEPAAAPPAPVIPGQPPPPTPEDQQKLAVDKWVAATQDVVDEFLEANRWNAVVDPTKDISPKPTRERELYRRVIRDGEFFLRFFFLEHGRTEVRTVEPEQVRQPPGGIERDGWSYGIRHNVEPFEDLEDIQEFHVVYQDQQNQDDRLGEKRSAVGDFVPISEMVHVKNADEDAATKRGLPTFIFETGEALQRASKLQKCISVSSAVRAATAEIWQFETATQGQITSMAAGLADHRRQDPVTGKTENIERTAPGTRRRIPRGQTLVPPPASAGVNEHLAAAQGDLRQASAGVCAPEYLTGDASNANYSSTKEAGTPFVRAGESDQEHFKAAYLCCVWRAVRWAVECGRLPKEVLQFVEIQVEAPGIETRDPLQEAQANAIRNQAKVLSARTWAQQDGLDPDHEEANFEEQAERTGGQGLPLPMPGDEDPDGPGDTPFGRRPAIPGGRQSFESRETRRLFCKLRRLLEAFDESKHKRGQPGNAGEFGPGGASATPTAKSSPSAGDVSAWLKTNFQGPAFKTLSPQQKKTINDYMGDPIINQALRSPDKASPDAKAALSRQKDHLDALIQASTIKTAVTLHRHIGEDYQDLMDRFDAGQLKPGEILHDPAYQSTSLTTATVNSPGGLRLEIHAPAGTHGAHLEGEESEILLPRNTKMKVVKVEHDAKGRRKLVVELAGQSLHESYDESKHKRNHGKFASSPGASGPATTTNAEADKVLSKRDLLDKMKALPAAAVKKAKDVAQGIYNKAEAKYGSRWAKVIVATAIITAPTPVMTISVLAMTGLAHLHTKYSAATPAVTESAEHVMTDEEIDAAAKEFWAAILKGLE